MDRLQNGFRIDALVETNEKDRFGRQRVVYRSDQHDLRCWRGELEPDIVDKFRTVGGGGTCRNLNDVVGRCWNAVDCTWLVFETRRLCAKPDPPTWHFWRDQDGDVRVLNLRHRGEGHHWLVESHGDEWRQVDGTFRLETQHLEWA